MSKTVIGVFETFEDARAAREALEMSGQRYDRAVVQRGDEFVSRMESTAPTAEGEDLRRGIQQFLEELGMKSPGEQRPIASEDGVLVVVTPDARAEAIAAFMDEHGAVDIDERRGRATNIGKEPRGATGFEAQVGGRTPPGMEEGEPGWTGSTDTGHSNPAERKRSEAEHESRRTCARIFNC
ncbi:hypothetical protein SVA_0863 [Sulfurifustis variabilis]|uniref:Uncharacterized protein n=1 Tax=Sulfurifustis variabilis TaxID=1675686 RepID=A0A1B4V4G3_9GAMM|nr:hypothetical protein [Sulfurifustis variabilis]BAU47442.1 hypothetical protein SVA_0863 [Sulfurifustis variabilis]